MYGRTRARRTIYLMLLLGLSMLIWGLWQFRGSSLFRYTPIIGGLGSAPATTATAEVAPVKATARPLTEEEVIGLIQRYNQADIMANQGNTVDPLLPYIHSDGPLYQRLVREYSRRIRENEVHNVALTRFWTRPPNVTDEEITIETRETWDETAYNSYTGEVLWSQTGIGTYQVYTLRKDIAGTWRIWDLRTETVEESSP